MLRTRRFGMHLGRAAIGMLAMVLWFTTLSLMPLAEATALSFTAPMFTSVHAVFFLGEVMPARRWTAIGIAFVGALIVIRPGAATLDPVALLAIVTALVWASSTILVKVMARTESAPAIVTWLTILLTPLSLVPALFVWVAPTLEQLLWAGLLGLAGSIGHVCLTRALAATEATVVVPFDYLRLPVVALIAFLAFGEAPDLWTWVGGVVIAGSGIYIAHREARAGRPVPPTAGSPVPQARYRRSEVPAAAVLLAPVRARSSALPDTVKGAGSILLSCLSQLDGGDGEAPLCSRLGGMQRSFFRALFGFPAALPFVAWGRFHAVHPASPPPS